MTLFERIKQLAKKRGISLQKVSTDLGFSENYIYGLKTKKTPSAEHISKIADYFNVSTDYLLGREKTTINQPTEDDLERMVDNAMSFGGKPLSDNDREFAKKMLRLHFETKED